MNPFHIVVQQTGKFRRAAKTLGVIGGRGELRFSWSHAIISLNATRRWLNVLFSPFPPYFIPSKIRIKNSQTVSDKYLVPIFGFETYRLLTNFLMPASVLSKISQKLNRMAHGKLTLNYRSVEIVKWNQKLDKKSLRQT